MTARMTKSHFYIYSLISLYYSLVVSISAANEVVVNAPCGKIRGVEKTDEASGATYVSFKGIPYARPPVGELRFTKPQPYPRTDGVLDATKETPIVCAQFANPLSQTGSLSEDCLVLNILSKGMNRNNQPLRKVLVFIHGGAFYFGSGYFYDPKPFVLSQDIIVVNINYRLGVLGFLSTENEASPGNYGLWDQTLALRWVKDNIRAFGGDPNDVTLAGQSAGGSSVGFQMISPHAKDLFTKAYPQSGTATSVYAISHDPQSVTLKIAIATGCWDKDVEYKMNVTESNEVIKCLRKLPVSAFLFESNFSFQYGSCVPVVDGDFITDTPVNLLKNDAYLDSFGFFDRSYLVGLNNRESTVVYLILAATKNETIGSTWQSVLDGATRRGIALSVGEKGASDDKVVDAVTDFYGRRFADNTSAAAEMITDIFLNVPAVDTAMAASRRDSCNAFLLYFDYFPSYVREQWRGTRHGADLSYWLDVNDGMGKPAEFTEEDTKLKQLFSSVIANFVRTGYPGRSLNDYWPRFDPHNRYYLNFNANPWVSNNLQRDRQEFWLQTIPELLGNKTA